MDAGLALLNPALSIHPSLVALDLGDCMLGDEGINLICGLLPPDGAKSGKHEGCGLHGSQWSFTWSRQTRP